MLSVQKFSWSVSHGSLQKQKRKIETVTANFSAIQLLNDPQTFAEKLFDILNRYDKRFSLDHKILIMQLLSRVMGAHKLCVLGFYTYIMKYLTYHQLRIPAILVALAQSVHELTPPGCIDTYSEESSPRICSPWSRRRGHCSRSELCSGDLPEAAVVHGRRSSWRSCGVPKEQRQVRHRGRSRPPTAFPRSEPGTAEEAGKGTQDLFETFTLTNRLCRARKLV